METVKGIGGIFFKSKESEKLANWYKEKLGVPVTQYGCGVFNWREFDTPDNENCTVWSVMPSENDYFGESKSNFMINYIVESLDKMVKQLKDAGIKIDEKIDENEQGRFAWGYDPQGNKFELWEPKKN